MNKSLTIGKKITLGFGLIFGLLSIVAVIAYVSMGQARRRLSLFAGSAQETYAAATLESSMQAPTRTSPPATMRGGRSTPTWPTPAS